MRGGAKSLTAFDRVVTDDVEQSAPGGAEQLNYQGAYARRDR